MSQNVYQFIDLQRVDPPKKPLKIRKIEFVEIYEPFSEGQAKAQADRCLSCGNCFECDGCLGSCPEDAIIKLGEGFRYRFDYEKCTGCATCFEQCPVHAIEMIPETK
jgi:Pyruvate/2-oxoacid:ferredoxin oxidoreductase delta subunit